MTQNCENAKYVLRTDDDQAIDTLHLPTYLNHYIGDSKTENERFYLCYALNETEPKRDPDNKWYVSNQDYPAAYYPEYCCGWAYVTNIPTIRSILGKTYTVKLQAEDPIQFGTILSKGLITYLNTKITLHKKSGTVQNIRKIIIFPMI